MLVWPVEHLSFLDPQGQRHPAAAGASPAAPPGRALMGYSPRKEFYNMTEQEKMELVVVDTSTFTL